MGFAATSYATAAAISSGAGRKEKKGVFKADQNMKYRVDESCIGCGLCAGTCPEVFTMSDDGVAVAIETEVSEDSIRWRG